MKLGTERVSLGYTCKSVNNAVKQTHRAKPNEKAESQAAGDMERGIKSGLNSKKLQGGIELVRLHHPLI